MSPTRETLFQQALRLDEAERLALAEQLYSSAAPEDPEVDAAWRAEVAARIAQIERGEVELIDGDAVMAKVRRLLRDRAA